MSPRARRGVVRPPARLQDLGAHGVVPEWEAGRPAPETGRIVVERAAGSPEAGPAAAWGDPTEREEERSRAAWFREQRPPHWG